VLLVSLLVLIIFLAVIFVSGVVTSNNHDDELHDHTVEIEGKDLKLLTVQDVADLWEINSEVLLLGIITEFDLKDSYTIDSILEDIRVEYAFSPALIKDIAEEIKQQGVENE